MVVKSPSPPHHMERELEMMQARYWDPQLFLQNPHPPHLFMYIHLQNHCCVSQPDQCLIHFKICLPWQDTAIGCPIVLTLLHQLRPVYSVVSNQVLHGGVSVH